MICTDHLAHAYFFAKNQVIKHGYALEIDWQDHVELSKLTESELISECVWVILSSGMKESVISKIFLKIKTALKNFERVSILMHREECIEDCLSIFNNRRKINAIIYFIDYINNHGFQYMRNKIETDGVDFLRTFPFLGQATSFHLAKNIGFNLPKPDRHLVRIADAAGFSSVGDLCTQLSTLISEKPSVIDVVLWRYATLDINYLSKVKWLAKRTSVASFKINTGPCGSFSSTLPFSS